MRTVGIVACSAEGAALCYRTICHEAAGLLGAAQAHPPVSLHGHSLADYVRCLDADDWDGVGELMLDSARRLHAAGAELLICPDNTIHRALPRIRPLSPLPWLHIAEVVAEAAALRGYRRVGLTGTHWLVAGEVYPDALAARGIEAVRPDAATCAEMGRRIMQELVNGHFPADCVAFFERTLRELRDAGCDAAVLGCTEIPLIIDERNAPLPCLDSTRLLARAALRWALLH